MMRSLPAALLVLFGMTSLLWAAEPARLATSPRRAYIPVEELETLLNGDQAGVLLSKREFEELSKAARENAGRSKAPALAIAEANYTASVDGSQLRFQGRLRFVQDQPGWQSLALPMRGIAVESATVNRNPVSLARDANGLRFFHHGQETGQLDLELSAALVSIGSDRTASFRLPAAGPATMTLPLPEGKQLLMDGLRVEREGESFVVPVGGRAVSLRMTDRRREETSDALLLASTAYGLNVERGAASWRAVCRLDIHGTQFQELTFFVPQGLELTNVDTPGLEAWTLSDDESNNRRTRIDLSYRQPITGSQQIVFEGVFPFSESDSWSVPGLQLPPAASHVGEVVLRHPVALRLGVTSKDGVTETWKNQPAGKSASPTTVRWFSTWNDDFDLEVGVREKPREVNVNSAILLSAAEHELTLTTRATVAVRHAEIYRLSFALPAEWTVTRVAIAGQPLDWQTSPRQAGTHFLSVELPQPLRDGTTANLELTAKRHPESWPPDTDGTNVALPSVRFPQATQLRGTLAVAAEATFDVQPSDLDGLRALSSSAHNAAWRFEDPDYEGDVTVVRKPSRIAVESSSYSRLDPQAFVTWWRGEFAVDGGGVRSLEIAVPASLSPDMQFHLHGTEGRITEQSVSDGEDASRLWTLRFDRRLTGAFAITADVSERRNENQTRFAIPEFHVRDTDRQTGFVAIEAASDQRLAVTATDSDDDNARPLPDVPLDELPRVAYRPKERIVAAHRFIRAGHQIAIDASEFSEAGVPVAVGHELSMHTILTNRGMQHRASLSFSASGVQSLLAELPETAELWAVELNGSPIEVRHRDGQVLIPLRLHDPNVSRQHVAMTYSTAADLNWKSVQAEPPRFSVELGTGEAKPLDVLDNVWEVSHPHGVTLAADTQAFRPLDGPEQFSVVEQWVSWLRRSRPRDFMPLLVFLAIVAVASLPFLVGWRRGASAGITLAVGLLCIVILVALLLPATQQAREAARRGSVKTAAPSLQMLEDETDSMMLEELTKSEARERAGSDSSGDKDESAQKDAKGDERPPAKPQAKMPEEVERPAEPLPPVVPEGDIGDGEQHAKAGARQKKRLSRLSLSVGFAPPNSYESREFRYTGAAASASRLSLKVTKRWTIEIMRWTCLLGALFLGWVIRNRSAAFRTAIVVTVVVGTIGGLYLLDSLWRPFAEAIAGGMLAAAILWIGRAMITRWLATRFATTAMLLLVMATSTWAAPPNPPATQPVPPRSAANQPAVLPTETSPDTVIYPYDSTDDPLSAERVLLSHEQYRALWNAAHPDRKISASRSMSLVAGAAYSGTIVDGNVRVTGRLVMQNFGTTAASVRLPLGEVAIRSAELDGASAIVLLESTQDVKRSASRPSKDQPQARRPQQNGVRVVSATKVPSPPSSEKETRRTVTVPPGLHILNLEFDVPLTRDGAVTSFVLPLHAVAAGKFSLQLPDDDVSVALDKSIAFRRRSANGKTLVEFPIAVGGKIGVSLRPKSETQARERNVLADANHRLRFDNHGETLTSDFTIQPRSGKLADVTFQIPDSHKLKEIRGNDVAGWQLAGENNRRLTVFLRREITDRTVCTLSLFRDPQIGVSPTSLAVGLPQPEDVIRETGTVIAAAPTVAFEMRAGESQSIRQINAPKGSTAPADTVLAWEYSSRPVNLNLTLSRRQPALSADSWHTVNVQRHAVHAHSRLSLDFGRTPRQRIAIRIPDDYRVKSVKSEQLLTHFIDTNPDEERILHLEWSTPRSGRVRIDLQADYIDQPFEDGAAVGLPATLGATESETHLAVNVDDAWQAIIEDSEHPDWNAVRGNIPQELREIAGDTSQFVYRSTVGVPEDMFISLEPAPARMTADAVTLVHVSEESVRHVLSLHWSLTQGAVDRVSFTTPAWLKDRLKFRADDLLRFTTTDLPNERVQWDLILSTSKRGEYHVQATARLSLPANNSVPAADVQFLPPRDADDNPDPEALLQRQFVLAVNVSQARLTLADPDRHTLIKRTELPERIHIDPTWRKLAVDIIEMRGDGRIESPTWTIERFEQQRGAALTVNLADVTLLLAADGTWREQVVYTVRNRARQFLPLALPENSRLLSVFVKDRPVRPAVTNTDAGTLHLIALPNTAVGDLSFPVRVMLSGELEQPLPQRVGIIAAEIELPVPVVPSVDDNAEYGAPVLETVWTVQLPEEFVASAVDDAALTNLTPADRDRLALARHRTLLRDAEELLEVTPWAANNRRVLSNIGKVQRELGNVSGYRDYGDYGGQSEYGRKVNDLYDKLSTLKSKSEKTQQLGTQSPRNEREAGELFEQQAEGQFRMNNFKGKPNATVDPNAFDMPRSQPADPFQSQTGDDNTVGLPSFGVPDVRRRPADSGKNGNNRNAENQPGRPGQFVQDRLQQAKEDDERGERQTSTVNRGLSLDMQLPQTGRTLTFAKSGGKPRLVLAVRSGSTRDVVWGASWAVGCVVLFAGTWWVSRRKFGFRRSPDSQAAER